jgi:hypothetical protein
VFSTFKKLVDSSRLKRSRKAVEHIFMFDPERKRDYLMDLRGILRTPGARRALPTLHKLEATVTRNETRIRIPHEAMLEIIRELALVESRIPPDSPLREVMNSVPGLALSMGVDPMPTSILMGRREHVPGELSTTEMNEAARQIGAVLAAPIEVGSSLDAPTRPSEFTEQERRRELAGSVKDLEPDVLQASAMLGNELAAFCDLLQASGAHGEIVAALAPQVEEAPAAWAWVRLLAAAEALGHPRADEWNAAFQTWVTLEHADLLPDLLAADTPELKFGVRRAELEALELRELGR